MTFVPTEIESLCSEQTFRDRKGLPDTEGYLNRKGKGDRRGNEKKIEMSSKFVLKIFPVPT